MRIQAFLKNDEENFIMDFSVEKDWNLNKIISFLEDLDLNMNIIWIKVNGKKVFDSKKRNKNEHRRNKK